MGNFDNSECWLIPKRILISFFKILLNIITRSNTSTVFTHIKFPHQKNSISYFGSTNFGKFTDYEFSLEIWPCFEKFGLGVKNVNGRTGPSRASSNFSMEYVQLFYYFDFDTFAPKSIQVVLVTWKPFSNIFSKDFSV